MARFLVTAGNTREMIDRVRDWGNIFTGNTGLSIAQALRGLGEVDLISSNPSHFEKAHASGLGVSTFRSHADLMQVLKAKVLSTAYDAIFMTAAVADYVPRGVYAVTQRTVQPDGSEHWIVRHAQAEKVKSDHAAIAVLGERTIKIIDRFRTDWGYRGLLVKFKLEVGLSVDALLEIAERSRVASGADYLVANTLDMVNGEQAGAYLLSAGTHEWVARDALAGKCAELVSRRLSDNNSK